MTHSTDYTLDLEQPDILDEVIEHADFPGIRFHDDRELTALLGSRIVERHVVHEWPLTRTEEIRLEDDRHLAYKVQLPPSVESTFYASAISPLLTGHLDLGQDKECSFLITDWVEAPSLHTLSLEPDQVVVAARGVADEIAQIQGEVPYYLDMSTPAGWVAIVNDVATKLRSLITTGKFPTISVADVEQLQHWAESPSIVSAATTDPRTVHGDLSLEEVFRTDRGWLIIDWQRPIHGPRELDLVSLLRHARINPATVVASEFVQLSSFLLLDWAVTASHDLLPDFPPTLPESWAAESLQVLLPRLPRS